MPQVSEPIPIRHVNPGHKFYLRSSVLHRFYISQLFIDFFYELSSYQAIWPSNEAGPFVDDILGNMSSRMSDLRQYRSNQRPSSFPRTCVCERGPSTGSVIQPLDFDFSFPPPMNSYPSELPSGPLEISVGEFHPLSLHHVERSNRGRTPSETVPEAPSPTESERNFDYVGDSEHPRDEKDSTPRAVSRTAKLQNDTAPIDNTVGEPPEPGSSNPRQPTIRTVLRPRIIDPASSQRASRVRLSRRPLRRTYAVIGEITEDGTFRHRDHPSPLSPPASHPEPRSAKGNGKGKAADDVKTAVAEQLAHSEETRGATTRSIAGGVRKRRRDQSTVGSEEGQQEPGPSRATGKKSRREDDDDGGSGSKRVRGRQ